MPIKKKPTPMEILIAGHEDFIKRQALKRSGKKAAFDNAIKRLPNLNHVLQNKVEHFSLSISVHISKRYFVCIIANA